MLSATFPHNIQTLTKDFLKEYTFLSVSRVDSTSENVAQGVRCVEDPDKRSVLLDIVAMEPQGGLTLSRDYRSASSSGGGGRNGGRGGGGGRLW
jgi:superfamily II DNA/RNA helicase